MSKETKSESVTAPLKPTGQTSYARWFVGLGILGPPYVILLVWLARTYLPAADADKFVGPLWTAWAALLTASGVATFAGGLLRSQGKIELQKRVAEIREDRGERKVQL